MGKITKELNGNFDVVIIGAGPAGASAAMALIQSGLRTVILEKCSLPRDKMCSGILFPSGRKFVSENFGNIPKNIFCEPREVKGNRMYMTNDSKYMEVPFRLFDSRKELPEFGFNVKRSVFDLWLCDRSDASLVGDCLFVDYRQDDKNILIKVKHSGRYVEIKTNYLIGADGPQSKVRRSVSPEFDKSVDWIPAHEEWYEGTSNLEPGWLYIFLDREVTDYFATVFHKDKEIHVTTGVKQGKYSKRYLKRLVEVLKEKHGLIIDRILTKRGIVLNDMIGMNNYIFGKGNVLITGEAAGILRGGEGITSALITGKSAGESILRSIKTGKTALECYEEHELLISEREKCEQVLKDLEAFLGFNWYRRE
jgi:flavin-dependent dehydrogenase